MKEQNFKNHSRYIPLYHFITYGLIGAALAVAIINLLHCDKESFHSALAIFLLSAALVLVCFYTRYFALKAQDRVIRVEENFRHYILAGKPLDKKIRMRQAIALRFASDEEFVELAKRAVDEKLSSKQIKEAIKQWRADHHRV